MPRAKLRTAWPRPRPRRAGREVDAPRLGDDREDGRESPRRDVLTKRSLLRALLHTHDRRATATATKPGAAPPSAEARSEQPPNTPTSTTSLVLRERTAAPGDGCAARSCALEGSIAHEAVTIPESESTVVRGAEADRARLSTASRRGVRAARVLDVAEATESARGSAPQNHHLGVPTARTPRAGSVEDRSGIPPPPGAHRPLKRSAISGEGRRRRGGEPGTTRPLRRRALRVRKQPPGRANRACA